MATSRKRISLKPRKIPQQPRAEQTVATILEAAARILETKGMAGLNTNAVAQRAGVSIGSLYQYFPGKDALIVALSLRERALFIEDALEALQQPTGRLALQHMIVVTVYQQLRRPVLARLLDFEENRPPIARELAASKGVIIDLIEQILARDDIPRQPDVAVATHDLGVLLRAMVDAAGEREELDRADLERRVSRAVYGYLGMPHQDPSANVSNRSRRRIA